MLLWRTLSRCLKGLSASALLYCLVTIMESLKRSALEDLWSSSLPFLLDLTWRWADRTVGLKPCRFSHVISVKNMSFAGRSSSHRTHQQNSVLRPGSTASPFTPRWVTFQNIHGLPTWIITFFQAKLGLTASPGPFPRPLSKSVREHGSENKREASWVCSLLH